MNATTFRKLAVLTAITTLTLALGAVPAWSQVTTPVSGKVTQSGKPLANVEVILTSTATGRSLKAKTDKSGVFDFVGIARGEYSVEIVSAGGDKLFKLDKTQITGEGGKPDFLSIDVNENSKGGAAPKLTPEEIERIKAQNAKATNMNALITQAQTALNAKNWADAVPVLQQMIAADPKRWEFYQALGNAQFNLAQYQESVDVTEKGITAAQAALAEPKADPVKIKAGIGQMLASTGNSYIKLNKMDLAVAAFTKAAEMDPNPAVAYFNLCATQYNLGQMKAAATTCDKAITADPKKADAYFIKGSALYGDGKLDANNKYIVPPGTTEALNKYLELAPDGSHAADVKAMLEALGAKIETTYKTRKK